MFDHPSQFRNRVLIVARVSEETSPMDPWIALSGKVVSCVASMGMNAGQVAYNNVMPGKYWLILAAAQPGGEGPVSLRITASP